MFNKNLESIDNLALKRRLLNISSIESRVGISYCITPTNDYVLLKDELPSDDLQNPREAIRTMLGKSIKEDLKPTDSDKKKLFVFLSFLGSLLILVSGLIFLYIAINDEDIDVELAFN